MDQELLLKYGCNPHQKPSSVFVRNGALPFTVENGRPGYINLLDALNGWQLVRELAAVTNRPCAASFKHVSPAGAATTGTLSPALAHSLHVEDLDLSPLANAYARARGADRMSSFGDWVALSHTCDAETARLLQREVSDGVIAPKYTPEALNILKTKRKGNYTILSMSTDYRPDPVEYKDVYGVTFSQGRNDVVINADLLGNIPTKNKQIPPEAVTDLLIALITLKYTQSNSVCYAKDGQVIGVGAGQQSRIHCTRLAGNKADLWHLRQHEKVLELPFLPTLGRPERDNCIDVYLSEDAQDVLDEDVWKSYFTTLPKPFPREEQRAYLSSLSGVSLGSDAFFPFGDNIERAYRSGVSYIAQPGGSIRDGQVIEACDNHRIAMAFTGLRLFHH